MFQTTTVPLCRSEDLPVVFQEAPIDQEPTSDPEPDNIAQLLHEKEPTKEPASVTQPPSDDPPAVFISQEDLTPGLPDPTELPSEPPTDPEQT